MLKKLFETGHSRKKKKKNIRGTFHQSISSPKNPGQTPWQSPISMGPISTHDSPIILTSLSLPVVQLTPLFLLYSGSLDIQTSLQIAKRFYDTGETFYKFRPKPLWVNMCKKIPGSYLANYNRRKATPPAIGPVLIVEGTKPQQGVFLSIWSFNRSK